jgi:hypothetical protein
LHRAAAATTRSFRNRAADALAPARARPMAVTRLSSMVTVPAVKSLPPAACAMGEPHGAGGFADLKLGPYGKDGIEVVDVEGEIDISTAPRLRGLLIDLASKNSYQLVLNLDKAGFLDSTGLGVLAGA